MSCVVEAVAASHPSMFQTLCFELSVMLLHLTDLLPLTTSKSFPINCRDDGDYYDPTHQISMKIRAWGIHGL